MSTLLDSGTQARGCRRKKSIVDLHARIPGAAMPTPDAVVELFDAA
jgi:hypothetical protein